MPFLGVCDSTLVFYSCDSVGRGTPRGPQDKAGVFEPLTEEG